MMRQSRFDDFALHLTTVLGSEAAARTPEPYRDPHERVRSVISRSRGAAESTLRSALVVRAPAFERRSAAHFRRDRFCGAAS
jgi:hypothetical protein